MKKSICGFILCLLIILLSGCGSAENVRPEIFTEEEFYSFEFLRADYTKEQMEDLGLKREENEIAGETKYSNDFIKYTYINFIPPGTPKLVTVDVFGPCEGPRGIEVGDTFDEVLALFPQDKDWRTSEKGEFYGTIYETEEWEYSGSVSIVENVVTNENKEITLGIAKWSPFLRFFFKDDILMHYTFYLFSD